MIDGLKRWAAARWWRASGAAARDRDALWGGATGLRIVCFHETLPHQLERVRRIVDWCRERFPMATPADADDLLAGRWRDGGADRLLVTFDDGLASNYEAAEWLARSGVAAVFFVVPSLVDRTMEEYLRFHTERGVRAHAPVRAPGTRGLAASQVREMQAMGHRIGAHNFAHRDLGRLHAPEELAYEIGNALDGVAALTGAPCRDFAIGFGQPENVSSEAAAWLLERCPRVFACHRGLNVPGRSPRFLLRHAYAPEHPLEFTRVCLEGGADHRLADRAREMARRVGVLPVTAATPQPA